MNNIIEKIVSGGQTGADQAALDVAIRLGIPHGGWVPKGRRTEAGALPRRYQMREMPTDGYAERTERSTRWTRMSGSLFVCVRTSTRRG